MFASSTQVEKFKLVKNLHDTFSLKPISEELIHNLVVSENESAHYCSCLGTPKCMIRYLEQRHFC